MWRMKAIALAKTLQATKWVALEQEYHFEIGLKVEPTPSHDSQLGHLLVVVKISASHIGQIAALHSTIFSFKTKLFSKFKSANINA